jgi:type I restriction enzyme S subunit
MRDGQPQGWVTCKLHECVDVLDSLRVPVNSDDRAKRQGNVPYYGATGQVGWIDDFIFNEELLLIGEDGAPYFDKTKPIAYIIQGKSWVNNHAHVLRAKTLITSNQYLKHYLDRFDFHESVNGTTRLKLTQGAMNEIPVTLAPFKEQQRIVAKLEALLGKVDACQKRLERIPAALKRFRQAVLAAACSGRLTADWREQPPLDSERGINNIECRDDLPKNWKHIKLGSLIEDGPYNGLYKPQSFYGSGTPIVRIDAFYDGTITSWTELKRVRLTDKERALFALTDGDILVNRVNSPKFLGKAALIKAMPEPCVYESNMMRLRIDTRQVRPDYAILYLQSAQGLEELRKNAKHAVNQSSINQEDVKAVIFALPPLPEQQKIVRRIEALFQVADRIEERYNKAKAHIDKLTQSILAKAFRGELVPQDPNDEPATVLLKRIRTVRGTLGKKRSRKDA